MTRREIIRRLKRYVVRQIYCRIVGTTSTADQPATGKGFV